MLWKSAVNQALKIYKSAVALQRSMLSDLTLKNCSDNQDAWERERMLATVKDVGEIIISHGRTIVLGAIDRKKDVTQFY